MSLHPQAALHVATFAPMNSDTPKDLRTVRRNEEGDSLELHDLDGNSYSLRINDHLRSLVNQPTPSYLGSTLRAVNSAASLGESEISIKEIQARLRAGESMESISESGHVSLEKVERYSQPILQERSYIISLAQKCEVKKMKSSFLELVSEKLVPRGVDMKNCEWNAYRNEDGTWQIMLEYPTRDGSGSAEWNFESTKRRITSDDDGARWIFDEEPLRPEVNVTPIRSEEAPPRLISIRSTPEPTTSLTSLNSDDSLDERGNSDDSADELDLEMDLIDESEGVSHDARRDGVKRKVSIPSWDDIMFGAKKDLPESE